VAAELEERPALRGAAIDAGSLEIVGAVLDMGAQLLVHVVVDARTMKQAVDKRTSGRRLIFPPDWRRATTPWPRRAASSPRFLTQPPAAGVSS
jgi:hypothetical protein